MNGVINKVAKILRADKAIVEKMVNTMERITLKKGVLDEIIRENEASIDQAIKTFGADKRSAEAIGKAIEDVLMQDDQVLFERLGKPNLLQPLTANILIKSALCVANCNVKGFFLKREKARQMIHNAPPPLILQGFGYKTAKELLEKEKLEEIFAALRFIETREWMNEVFVKQYEHLTPQDFEERLVEVFVMDQKWLSLAEKFVEKKYHNVSHLKEIGVVFIIPIALDAPGAAIRLFLLILHYLYEVPFYAKLIERYAKDSLTFPQKLMSLIRGDVGEFSAEAADSFIRWLIVQRYLSKDDENDPRLFQPHVNPEAIHWRKAQKSFIQFIIGEPHLRLSGFSGLDYVGDFFQSERDGESLVSFNLVDNVMSLIKRESLVKYLYHHQEALWNRIFTGFLGEEVMEELIIKNLDRGYIEISERQR